MYRSIQSAALVAFLIPHSQASIVTWDVQRLPPVHAGPIDPTPIGVSFEFFMWPSYMRNITPPLFCLDHFKALYNKPIPVRIGGTTQDRASYDPDADYYVSYHVDDPLVAPLDLKYGPKFFDLIPELGAETILGLNRGRNNKTNTYTAALEARKRASKFLFAIELGNEPDLYLNPWKQPIAVAPWNETQEGASNADWAQGFIDAWPGKEAVLMAGSYAVPIPLTPNYPNSNYLIGTAYNQTVMKGTKLFNGHLYALSNGTSLQGEMTHSRTSSDIGKFVDKTAAAKSVNKKFYLGETNFHGLDEEMDATFGAALVTLDRSLRGVSMGLERLFYHQGTINQAFFNWWSDEQVEAPFYGGFVSALALAGGESILAADNGTTNYAQYVIYAKKEPVKVVLINTDYFSGNGTRTSTSFKLKDLSRTTVKALRFTATSSEVTTQKGDTSKGPHPTIGGQYFSNTKCEMLGRQTFEETKIQKGEAVFNLAASEALIIYLQ